MKFLPLALALFASVLVGCAHGPQAVSAPDARRGDAIARDTGRGLLLAGAAFRLPFNWPRNEAASPATADEPGEKAEGDESDFDYGTDDVPAAEQVTIADPWEPFNRAMFTFNDRLYFWVLKPVAEGYSAVLPEPARVSVGNFFSNLRIAHPFRQLPAAGQFHRRRHGAVPLHAQQHDRPGGPVRSGRGRGDRPREAG